MAKLAQVTKRTKFQVRWTRKTLHQFRCWSNANRLNNNKSTKTMKKKKTKRLIRINILFRCWPIRIRAELVELLFKPFARFVSKIVKGRLNFELIFELIPARNHFAATSVQLRLPDLLTSNDIVVYTLANGRLNVTDAKRLSHAKTSSNCTWTDTV